MTNSLPGQQPGTLSYSSADYGGLSVRNIARYQRAIIMCILAYIVCYVLLIATKSTPLIALLFVVLIVAANITACVFVFMLAIKIYGTGSGVLLGIGTLVPLVGLIVLLTVNGKATKILRNHNIHVGFLGADMSKVA